MHTVFVIVTVVGYFLTLALLPVILLTKKKQSVSTVAWMMIVVMMPFVGAFLFVVFGINRVDQRLKSKQEATKNLNLFLPQLTQHHELDLAHLPENLQELKHLAERISGTHATLGNNVELLIDANETFDEIANAITSARSTIHLEYYIWQPDKLGTRLRDLLISKAKEGIRVRFLYDAIGSSRLTRRFLAPMREAGIDVASFVPGQSFRERWSVNLRSHRKIVIVDGKTGFTGGMNVGDEYLGLSPHFGHWRDTHLRLHGPTVLQLQAFFAFDWKYATGEDLTDETIFPSPEQKGDVLAQVVAGGPDDEDDIFHNLMFAAINSARQQVTLATSYFVPTASLVSALEASAERGVKTRVMLSGPKTYMATLLAARSYYDSLLHAGVEIYEYQDGQLHSKTLTIDGTWALVGTPNFDARSLFLNFEVGVILYDQTLSEQLEYQFGEDLKLSKHIDPARFARRSTRQILMENFFRMFSPVL